MIAAFRRVFVEIFKGVNFLIVINYLTC